MKKFFLTALIAVSLISSSFAANENNVSNQIRNGFAADFKNAENVNWKSGESFVTASFVLDDKATEAFYDFNGTLIGTSYAIAVDQLPVSAKRTLAKKYNDYTVKETISFEKNNELSYFVSLTNGKESLVLQIQEGQVSVYKKLR